LQIGKYRPAVLIGGENDMKWERRSGKRLRFEEERPFTLRFQLGTRTVEAEVLDLSKAGLKIQLPDSDGELAPSTVLERCTLVSPLGIESPVHAVTVVECLDELPDVGRAARLRTDDDASRASLWLAMERLRTRDAERPHETRLLDKREVPAVPGRGIYTEEARLERLEFARRISGVSLDRMEHTNLIASKLTGNIENFFGGVEIPVGLAGPLLFFGQRAKGFIVAPFATTEGALVASASRGATAISRSGGAVTRVLAQRMMRVPLFVLDNIDGVFLFVSWIRDHVDELRREVRKVSQHAHLAAVTPHVLGNMVHVSFVYETGDAAGQNMVTACTWHAIQWLMRQMKHFDQIKFKTFGIDSNMSGDKKVNFHSFIAGRGIRVEAECHLHETVLKEVLKVTPEELVRGHHFTLSGSLQIGMIGYNMNIANVLAAIFAATGQDIASVHESALGHFDMQLADDGVYASMQLPSLIVGTMGGGTHLPQQQELLQLMGCSGSGKVFRLAEIIAGFCLALDLSTLAAGVSGQFATAHERLGRSRPVKWFTLGDLTPEFFQPGVRRALGDDQASVTAVEAIEDARLGTSIITDLSSRKVQKLLGLLPMRLRLRTGAGGEGERDVLVKVKPLDDEVTLMGTRMAGMCNAMLAQAYNKYKQHLGGVGCHLKEHGIYQQTDPRFTDHMPLVYETYANPEREAYVVVLELLRDVVLIDSENDPGSWGRAEIEAVLRGAARFHSVWYGREQELLKQPWLGPVMTAEQMTEMIPLWEALGVHAHEEFPEWLTQENLALHRELVNTIPRWWLDVEHLPRTLIHNDFNLRNICLRETDGGLRLCAFDWELATLHVPQHDLAELLCWALSPNAEMDEIDHYVEFHRRALEQETGQEIDEELWRRGYKVSLYDLIVNRMALYVLAHTFRHYPFMQRVVDTLRRLIQLETNLDI
jgi:hydroxymethylglutaryl-CoA reductase (NADPH)